MTVKDWIIKSMGSEWMDKGELCNIVSYKACCYGGTVERELRKMVHKAYKGYMAISREKKKGTEWLLVKELEPFEEVQSEPEEVDTLFTDTFFGGKKPELDFNFLRD